MNSYNTINHCNYLYDLISYTNLYDIIIMNRYQQINIHIIILKINIHKHYIYIFNA